MLHHKHLADAIQADRRASARRRRPPSDNSELERALIAWGDEGQDSSFGIRRLTARIRAVAHAHRLRQHDADDVVQTTWLRLIEHLDQLREPRAIGAWMDTTARRESLQLFRASGRTHPVDPEQLEDRVQAPENENGRAAADYEAPLNHAINALPRRQRELMRMLLAEPPKSYAEVAAALEMPVGSIGPTRQRALERLRRDPDLAVLARDDDWD